MGDICMQKKLGVIWKARWNIQGSGDGESLWDGFTNTVSVVGSSC